MAASEKDLTVRAVTAAEILPYVQRAAQFALPPERDEAAEIARHPAFIVSEAGVDVFGYTLQQVGNDLWISSAFGNAKIDLVELGLMLAEKQGAEMDSIMFQTIRPGLVRKAKKRGYEVAAYIMRKKLR